MKTIIRQLAILLAVVSTTFAQPLTRVGPSHRLTPFNTTVFTVQNINDVKVGTYGKWAFQALFDPQAFKNVTPLYAYDYNLVCDSYGALDVSDIEYAALLEEEDSMDTSVVGTRIIKITVEDSGRSIFLRDVCESLVWNPALRPTYATESHPMRYLTTRYPLPYPVPASAKRYWTDLKDIGRGSASDTPIQETGLQTDEGDS